MLFSVQHNDTNLILITSSMPIRKAAISTVEQQFILKCLKSGARLDDRQRLIYRNFKISFGIDLGCCTVDLGNTKVMAQVSCVLDRPKESRPNEGRVNVHVELSAIAFPTFDPSKPGELGITIQRMLERSLLFSRAIDLEELCVRVGEKVWALHLYIHILSHDGNLVDCSYVAAIAALKHFRRPDVTVIGQEVVVHTVEEKNPIPLTLHHMPLCISFAFFNECDSMAVDPTYLEEKVMDGVLMISMNKHQEMCGLQMSGEMNVTKEQILHCTNVAFFKVKNIVSFIIKAIDHDISEKKLGKLYSSSSYKHDDNLKSTKQQLCTSKESEEIHIEDLSVDEINSDKSDEEMPDKTNSITNHWVADDLTKPTSAIGVGVVNQWLHSDVSVTEFSSKTNDTNSVEIKSFETDLTDDKDEEIVTEML